MHTMQGWFLLDVNTDPSLLIHRVTDVPRNIAAEFLAAWIALARRG